MTSDCNGAEARISNWTLATGMRPGERDLSPADSARVTRRSTPDDKP